MENLSTSAKINANLSRSLMSCCLTMLLVLTGLFATFIPKFTAWYQKWPTTGLVLVAAGFFVLSIMAGGTGQNVIYKNLVKEGDDKWSPTTSKIGNYFNEQALLALGGIVTTAVLAIFLTAAI